MKQNFILLAFSVGIFCPNYFFTLPPSWPSWLLLSICVCLFYWKKVVWPLGFSVGLIIGVYQAQSLQSQILLPDHDSEILVIHAQVKEIQTRKSGERRLEFQKLSLDIDQIKTLTGTKLDHFPGKVLLNWYGKQQLEPGQTIVAEAKLRRPRGLQNPGLFDYQKWLIAQRIGATGYIRDLKSFESTKGFRHVIARWRHQKSMQIDSFPQLKHSAIHKALAIGDGSTIDGDVWDRFRYTGTAHLMVISGLHVGLVGTLAYFIGFQVGRIASALFGFNAVRFSIIFSLSAAFLYSSASGFDLPAQRALIMMSALLIPRFLYFKISRWFCLNIALVLVALTDPTAVLTTGFWMSFGAVLVLFLGFPSQVKPYQRSSSARLKGFIFSLVKIQLIFLGCFFGVSLWQGIPVSPVSFLANMVSVPLVSFLLVPGEVMALAASLFWDDLAYLIWMACDWLATLEIEFLEFLEFLPVPRIYPPINWGVAESLAVVSALSILVLPGYRLKLLATVGCLPLLFSDVSEDYFLKVKVFDVGQGLSVLVQQPGYNLVYDTGPRFSERFDSGSNIVAPSLLAEGIQSIDKLVVSHSDYDHRGGVEGLMSKISIAQMDSGQMLNLAEVKNENLCERGKKWQVGRVEYQYLWPNKNNTLGRGLTDNDSSCVLHIRAGNIEVLLPGDIGARTERQILKSTPDLSRIDLLIVPHHGSKSSSSTKFVRELAPKIAIVSAGMGNRFGHPHTQVSERYSEVGSELKNTAVSGAIEITWRSDIEAPDVVYASESKIFWWQK